MTARADLGRVGAPDDVGLSRAVPRLRRWACGRLRAMVGPRTRRLLRDDQVTNSAAPLRRRHWSVLPALELSLRRARLPRRLLSDRYFHGHRARLRPATELEPETSNQLDLAVRWRSGRWQLAGYGTLPDRGSHRTYKKQRLLLPQSREQIEARARGDVARGAAARLGAVAGGRVLDDGTPTDDVPARAGRRAALDTGSAGRGWCAARPTTATSGRARPAGGSATCGRPAVGTRRGARAPAARPQLFDNTTRSATRQPCSPRRSLQLSCAHPRRQ